METAERPPDEKLRDDSGAPASPQRRLALRPGLEAASTVPGTSASGSLEVPVVAAVRDARRLSAALGPFMVREPRPAFAVDVDATIEAMLRSPGAHALALPVDPVPKAGERRWLRAVLVREAGPQVPIWGPTLRELSRLLGRGGAFRTVRHQDLAVGDDGGAVLIDRSTRRTQDAVHAPWHRDELIIVASDFVSPAWQDGRFPACVDAWGAAQQVLLLHLLPRRLWAHTWTGAPDLSVGGQVPGGPSAALLVSRPTARSRRTASGPRAATRALAIASVDPADLGRWARVAVAQAGHCDAVAMGSRRGRMPQWPPAAQAQDAAARYRDRAEAFKARASPQARQLARCLAFMAPLTLPMMQWAGAALVPDCDAGHLAEFFLGGLLHPAGVDANGEAVFDLHDELRAHLAQGMPMAEALAIIRTVGDRLMQAHGLEGDALMSVSAQPIDSLPAGATDLRAFASVTRAFLVRAGRLAPDAAAADAAPTAPTAAAVQGPPSDPPSHPGRHTFLDHDQLVEAVLASGRVPRDDPPLVVLPIFRTQRQQTALAFSRNSVVITLDDPDTRGSGRLVQRVMSYMHALAASARADRNGSATVQFGNLEGRWYYSPALFARPEDLEKAIAQHASRATNLALEPARSEVPADAVVMTGLAVLAGARAASDLDTKGADAFASWLVDGAGLSQTSVALVRDGRWSSLREALAAHFRRARERTPGTTGRRRLYLYLACRAGLEGGRLHLQFSVEHPDDVQATPFVDFENYLEEQLERGLYTELVLIVDALLGEREPAVADLPTFDRPSHKPRHGGSYLRLLSLHPPAVWVHSLVGQVVLAVTGRTSPPSMQWMASDLVRRLRDDAAARTEPDPLHIRWDGPDDIPPPSPRPSAAGLQVIGSQLAEFGEHIAPRLREAVTHSLLLAQAAASARRADSSQVDWYTEYLETLKGMGWSVDSLSVDASQRQAPYARMHEELSALLKAHLGPSAAGHDALLRLLDNLEDKDQDQRWLQLFHREARTVSGAEFQVGTVDADEQAGIVHIRFLMVEIKARRKLTQILFMRMDQGDVELHTRQGRLDIPITLLDANASTLAEHVRSLGLDQVAAVVP